MNAPKYHLLLWILIAALLPLQGIGQQSSDTTNSQQLPAKRDGQHDFDFQIGTWKTHLWRLLDPLTGSKKWVEYDGTSVVRKVWNGRANLVELVADGPAGHFEGLNLRLYNPPVEPEFCQQQGRYPDSTHDRRVQEWPRRVFRHRTIRP